MWNVESGALLDTCEVAIKVFLLIIGGSKLYNFFFVFILDFPILHINEIYFIDFDKIVDFILPLFAVELGFYFLILYLCFQRQDL